ncbi:protein kinase domain-containing protein [Hyalangium gracile]|uniref:protein kinase domain-containing protein n=1 Tax=Hyalangium gracile TaxID=394092 RepID=UPI001CCF1158|nr:protein kinase [Hyalangium gracile]
MREDKATPFGKYELLERLGVGGMANVYRARYTAAPGISKQVVIKRVLSAYAENPVFVEQFIHEARISVGLSHGNIVQVFDFGQVNDEYFLAMELVEGQPLSRVLKRAQAQGLSKLPQPLAASIAIEICKGLHHAHTRTDEQGRPLGVVHRDVSPDNVLISYDGEVKLTDFGIAKAELAGRPVTAAGTVKGKLYFLSPEQARGDELDARSDVYSVGVVLYRMLCGRLPIDGQEPLVMERIVRGELTPPLELNPELDGLLVRIVMRALSTSRGARFQSAEELQQELSRWMATRAPLFTSSTLKHLMGWLHVQELKALGRPPVLPQEFMNHLALWRDPPADGTSGGERPTGRLDGPGTSLRATRPATDVVDEERRETELLPRVTGGGVAREDGSGGRRRLLWRALGVAAVAWALLLVYLAVRGPPPLEIHSEPPGAQVRLDGEIRGVTPLTLEDVERDRPHTVELILLGWRQWEEKFEAKALGTKLEVELEELDRPAPAQPVAVVAPDADSDEPPADSTSKDSARPKSSTRSSAPRLRITAAPNPSAEVAVTKYKQGLKQLSRGQLAKAKELFWACLANDPKAARCFRRLGEVSAQLGSTEEAREYYTRFLELDPQGEGAEEARAYLRQPPGKGAR